LYFCAHDDRPPYDLIAATIMTTIATIAAASRHVALVDRSFMYEPMPGRR